MKEELSDCCGAKFYDETDVCSACKEHSEPFYEDTDVCSDCKEHSEPSNDEMFVSMSYLSMSYYTRIINVINQNLYKI